MGPRGGREHSHEPMSKAHEIDGPRRVAAFLLSLEPERATQVLRHLEPELVTRVAEAMSELGDEFRDPNAVEELYLALARRLHEPVGIEPPDPARLSKILTASLGEKQAARILEEIHERRAVARPFAEIERQAPERIAACLADETAEVIALVMGHCDPQVSADVLGLLDSELAREVVQRMVHQAPTTPLTVRSVAQALKRRLDSAAAQPKTEDPAQRMQSIAEILTHASRELESSVLEAMEAEDEQAATRIREFMFTWNDLASVDKRSMQKILASVDTRTLAVSLKACPADVEANIMANLSSRVREMVAEERELAGPMPMSEVLAARAELMRSVHELIDSGEFSPVRGGEELVT